MADTNWVTTVTTTTARYLKEVEVNILRQRALLAMLESKGRIVYNDFGVNLDWKVEYNRPPIQTFSDGGTITFDRQDRYKTATLGWRSYVQTDIMSKAERLANRSNAQIIDRYAATTERLSENIRDNFCDELYANGYAAGSNRLHGIESFCTTSSTQSDRVVLPTATYAGLSCAPGNYGGDWTGNWPIGTGPAKYDFWSPLLVNFTDADWGGSTHTWETHGFDAVRYALTHCNVRKSRAGKPDLVLVGPEMFRQLKGVLDDKERINVENNYSLVKLGFTDVIQIDGCDVTYEYGLAADTGYVFNTNQMELRSRQGQLFNSSAPTWNNATQTWEFLIDFYGNARFNPRGQAKLYAYG